MASMAVDIGFSLLSNIVCTFLSILGLRRSRDVDYVVVLFYKIEDVPHTCAEHVARDSSASSQVTL